MLRTSLITSAALISSFSFAGNLTDSAAKIQSLSQKISNIAQRVEYGNTRGGRAQRNLKSKLTQLILEAKSMRQSLGGAIPGRPGGDRPGGGYPGNGGGYPGMALYSAECHIDDDPDLTFNQQVVDVQGSSVSFLISECKQVAQAMYPRKPHASAILNLKTISAPPRGMQSGLCHYDDDPNMTFDQFELGTIYGTSMANIIKDCNQAAKMAFKSEASAGLKKVNVGITPPFGVVSGTCHIDDDPDMTFDQFVPGVVFGTSIRAISQDCEDLAISTFGSQSASGVINIKR